MIKIALCEDISAHAKAIERLLDVYQKERPGIEFELKVFESGEELLRTVQEEGNYDIYLLDIVMAPPDGITLARQIREFDAHTPLIFLTHTDSFAMDAFRVSATQYILKPVCKDVFFTTLDKIISDRVNDKDDFFTIAAPGRAVTLLHSSIILVEKSGRSLHFHLESGETIVSKAVRISFDQALSTLLADRRFVRVHQSFAINMEHVRELTNSMFIMVNGQQVAVPRPKLASVKRTYAKFIKE